MYAEKLNLKDFEKLYYYLYLTRYADELICKNYKQGMLQESHHSCQGEEAIAVGSGILLGKDDYVCPSLRARGYFYLKGATLREMMAGMYGKVTGPSRGKNTSHHMGDMDRGIVCGSGIIGGALPVAVGIGLGIRKRGSKGVALVSFGDGSTSRGDFHEAMNLAAVWKLPVLFVCENNRWAMGNPIEGEMAIDRVAIRADAYGMPGVTANGNDVLAVYEATAAAIERARTGGGPTLLEFTTNRWTGHGVKDADAYRDRAVVESYKQDCPVANFRKYLLDKGILKKRDIDRIEKAAIKEVDDAVEYAVQSDHPPVDIVATNVYV
jgi:TPP-dependent pyruvate/acetoin dehydrogenase alpha subunit